MAPTTTKTEHLVYVGIFDEVEVADTGQIATRGEAVEVPAELAGREPSGDPPGPDATDAEREAYDPGEGLLAQPSNWRKARKSEISAASKEAASGGTATSSSSTSGPSDGGDDKES